MDWLKYVWIAIQVLVGYNLIWPCFLFVIWNMYRKNVKLKNEESAITRDYAIVVTAYQNTNTLTLAVDSILKVDHSNYLIYVVADNCDISSLSFSDPRVILLKPNTVLASNTKSHQFAIDHFRRPHDIITIIDSDNLVHPQYLKALDIEFDRGYLAAQGIRKAKNLNTTLASLDAARDIFYHFYDGRILFDLGSSATLSGSGMAFSLNIYQEFLSKYSVHGAGFDKVLQAWLVGNGYRIAFSEDALVYDEKTSMSDQLVNQRSRWINTWFKYFRFGFGLVFKGISNFSRNQILFGLTLLRPPLFIFILFSMCFAVINVFISVNTFILWLLGFVVFIFGFVLSLGYSGADKKIYTAMIGVPKFVYLQILSLLKVRNANKNSVATSHYENKSIEDL